MARIAVYAFDLRTPEGVSRRLTFRGEAGFPLVGYVLAPERSTLWEPRGKAAVLKVPKGNNPLDCWVFTAPEAVRTARLGGDGMEWVPAAAVTEEASL